MSSAATRPARPSGRTAPPPPPTPVTRSPPPARLRSASRTSSSTSSASRPSSSPSTRPPASSTACAGRSSPRSTRSRPTTAATSTSPPPARWAGCSSCPPTWKQYGVDANRDGLKDPYNPVDAIFAAARYLRAAGAETDIRKAIFAYNHADWYVDSVLMRARLIGGLPSNFVGSLTGLTQGRFPVYAKANYAGQVEKRDTKRKTKVGDNAALVVEANQDRRGIKIYARRGAPVVAVNDGRIVRMGETERLGRYVQMQDSYGNTYTYGAPRHRRQDLPRAQAAQDDEGQDRQGARAAQRRAQADRRRVGHRPQRPQLAAHAARHPPRPPHPAARRAHRRTAATVLPAAAPAKQRLFAHPSRPNAMAAGGEAQLGGTPTPPPTRPRSASTPATSSSARSRRARASSPARSSAASARSTSRRPRTSSSSSARPAAAPRASTRSRSSTAGSCSSRPRSTAPRARTRSSATSPTSPRSARSC